MSYMILFPTGAEQLLHLGDAGEMARADGALGVAKCREG